MPLLIVYDPNRPALPARVVRRGDDLEALIQAALDAGASRVRVVSRATGREMRVVEAVERVAG